MSAPEQTREERVAAGQAAVAARRVRAEAKAALGCGQISVAELLRKAQDDPALARMPVVEMLQALPGIGEVKARKVMKELRIAESRRLRGLGLHQRAALEERYAV